MMRTATFSLDGSDDHEAAWNEWVDELKLAGLRPADEPLRWTDTAMTYRVFSLEVEGEVSSLRVHISKLAALAGVGMLFLVGSLGRLDFVLGTMGGASA